MKYKNIPEEEIKNKVTRDFFQKFDCTRILGKIDFAVKLPNEEVYLLWAEAKQKPSNILVMLAQLVLTVGKARTFDEILPPLFLGCYDSEKIVFVPYSEIQDIFYQNDFNWNVAPSNPNTKEFKQVYAQVKKIVENDMPWKTWLFYFEEDERELRRFIRENFTYDADRGINPLVRPLVIDKNNFIIIYSKWLETVRPTIAVKWEKAKARGIIDGDFYLADLLSADNKTLKEKLFVLLYSHYYEFDRVIDEDDIYNSKRAEFSDNQKAHTQFWAKYARPPHEDYWDYIVERRDLLVPQDVRERKGSFFTPGIWVELSQRYIAGVFGENWQEEYYVWDCAAGTGNLLTGLTDKYNIWASTLDRQDVDVMRDRIRNGANLLEDHVFQFDFLNDDFSKLPENLQKIINDPKKRNKLIIYINPPYAEAGNSKQRTGTGENKGKTATANATYSKYKHTIGKATNELFVQFLIRIYCEIPAAKIANFSKLKNLQSSNFSDFRKIFRAKLEKIFLVPADTFDNVNGQFPIGFFVWDTKKNEEFKQIQADIFDKNGNFDGTKMIYNFDDAKPLTLFTKTGSNGNTVKIGHFAARGNDFQNQNAVFIDNQEKEKTGGGLHVTISDVNLIEVAISFAVRKVVKATWLNDRDQFLYPNEKWKTDREFQNDCLAYTLFNNNIQSKYGINHWIPFTEYQVNAREKFDSNFMTGFIEGKAISNIIAEPVLFYGTDSKTGGDGYKPQVRKFSETAKNVFRAGKELWKYYHAQPYANVNASLYDIREHFQGRNEKGKMNNKSTDEQYNELIGNLRENLKALAAKIEPKVYEYEFLKR